MNFLLAVVLACGCVCVGRWLYSCGVIAYSRADAILNVYRAQHQLKKQFKNKEDK